MGVKNFTAEFHDDGTFQVVPPSLSITPGTDFALTGEAKQSSGTGYIPVDLTDCTITMALINSAGNIRVYQTGTPAINIVNSRRGRFTITIPYKITKVLTSGDTHTMEVKSINANGERRQICYVPVAVLPTALLNE